MESCTSKCCQSNVEDFIFNSDVETWPILNGNSNPDHMKPPVTVVNRYAAFEVNENSPDSTHSICEPTVLDVVPNAEIDTLSKRQKSRRKAKKGNQRLTGAQMLGKTITQLQDFGGGHE